ncbi:hypothetical protein [Microbacterium sp. SORGH_AS_0888]|uniref:hypothetical protein n=1 Tax=Microbacterium sp. SORGH_AS_0888 TaxID=3041791 RepID=UPI00277E77A8|nr:hypothetical protein [Microbacterium sp. SORGH_AS_0888]MDQ1130677.1 hypothetical protein [Microbacterium sp. SORGH_AS_0888]
MSIQAHTSDIHPEIAAPAWATDRHLEDDGHAMVDQHEYEDNNVSVTLSVTHSFTSHGVRAHKEHAFISWANLWPGECVAVEEMTVFIEDLPEVAAVLLRAYERATTARTVTRAAGVDDHLRTLDEE